MVALLIVIPMLKIGGKASGENVCRSCALSRVGKVEWVNC